MSKHLKRRIPPRVGLLNTFQAASYLARVTRDYERNFHELLRSNRRPLFTKTGGHNPNCNAHRLGVQVESEKVQGTHWYERKSLDRLARVLI